MTDVTRIVAVPHPDCKADHGGREPEYDDPAIRMDEWELDHMLQQVWRRVAPPHERNCDWWRSMDEPWVSLREITGH